MDWTTLVANNWHVKLVAVLLIWAAYIDGKQLRVPNWLTFPMILSGLAFNASVQGWGGAQFALLGIVCGLLTLLPLYSIGGMGAGDVKLMAGLGAWLGWEVTFWAFIATVVVGACMAIVMAWRTGQFQHHAFQAWFIVKEVFAVKDPRKLSAIAAERKPRMLLLPYGIPICIGAIGYFLWAGML